MLIIDERIRNDILCIQNHSVAHTKQKIPQRYSQAFGQNLLEFAQSGLRQSSAVSHLFGRARTGSHRPGKPDPF